MQSIDLLLGAKKTILRLYKAKHTAARLFDLLLPNDPQFARISCVQNGAHGFIKAREALSLFDNHLT